jgi:hypothetical protein
VFEHDNSKNIAMGAMYENAAIANQNAAIADENARVAAYNAKCAEEWKPMLRSGGGSHATIRMWPKEHTLISMSSTPN